MKIVINDTKTGKSYKKELNEQEANTLINKKIKDSVKGETIGLTGYELEITGGTDSSGFPMRADVQGTKRKKLLLTSGPGVKIERDGMRKRKSVAGNTIDAKTTGVNLKITKHGSKSIEDILGIKPEEKASEASTGDSSPQPTSGASQTEAPKEKPKEEKPEAPKEEPKEPEAKPKEEPKKEEVKEEPKSEEPEVKPEK